MYAMVSFGCAVTAFKIHRKLEDPEEQMASMIETEARNPEDVQTSMTRISAADIESDEEENHLAPNINESQAVGDSFPP